MDIAPHTIQCMEERHAGLADQFPKHIRLMARGEFDLLVNMSGQLLPDFVHWPVRTWHVPDPVAMDYEGHCAVRDQIERLVMELILELRREGNRPWLERRGI
jgi:protein-tyrosine-phosphatase